MIRQSVSSSNISAVGYDTSTSILEVKFHSGGTYRYSGVPVSIYNGLMSASSHGTFLHVYIKDKYPCSKIS